MPYYITHVGMVDIFNYPEDGHWELRKRRDGSHMTGFSSQFDLAEILGWAYWATCDVK